MKNEHEIFQALCDGYELNSAGSPGEKIKITNGRFVLKRDAKWEKNHIHLFRYAGCLGFCQGVQT